MAVYYAGFLPSDGVYAVLFPDLPGCNSQGATLEEAFAQAMEALAGHLEALADDGDLIPRPMVKTEALARLKKQAAALGLAGLPKGSEFHPVPAPRLETRTRQVAVSFSRYKLEMIDRKAKEAGLTRSGFLARAAEEYQLQP